MTARQQLNMELDRLCRQFGNRQYINLAEYAELFRIGRKNAARHLRNLGIPFSEAGNKQFLIALEDIAVYLIKRKTGAHYTPPITPDAAKHRRGFAQKQFRERYGFG